MTARSHRRKRKKLPAVLQVLPALETDGGGVERGTVDVALALQKAGYSSMVASAGGGMTHELTRAGIEHFTMPLDSKNPLVMIRNIGRLGELVQTHDIDIIHARSRAPAWSAYRAAAANDVGFVTTVHAAYSGAANFLKNRYNRVMTRGDRVIAVSRFIAEHTSRYYKLSPDRISVIHRGVDTDIFDPAKVSHRRTIQLAEKWRLTERGPIIMLPGRLTRSKGQELMIKALAHLGRKDIACILVGSDQGRTRYRNRLENMVNHMGLSSIVHFAGHCADMPAAYMLADVVVCASMRPEGFGRVVAEAQALGKPVLVSDHGGAREAIRRSRTGWLFPPGDWKALAEMLEKALSLTTQQRLSLSELAVGYIQRNFTNKKMCSQTLALYKELYENRSSG